GRCLAITRSASLEDCRQRVGGRAARGSGPTGPRGGRWGELSLRKRRAMATKKTQYVLVPAAGLTASSQNPKQMQFFQTLHATSLAAEKIHSVSTESGALPVKVLDSIGETKPKLIEAAPEDLAALRASHPSVRILPVVYFQPAVMRYEIGPQIGLTAAKAKKVAKAARGISITITSTKGGSP